VRQAGFDVHCAVPVAAGDDEGRERLICPVAQALRGSVRIELDCRLD
jgi:hypothetical protein